MKLPTAIIKVIGTEKLLTPLLYLTVKKFYHLPTLEFRLLLMAQNLCAIILIRLFIPLKTRQLYLLCGYSNTVVGLMTTAMNLSTLPMAMIMLFTVSILTTKTPSAYAATKLNGGKCLKKWCNSRRP